MWTEQRGASIRYEGYGVEAIVRALGRIATIKTSTPQRVSLLIGCLLACWLGAAQAQEKGGDAGRGEKLVRRLGCMECHTAHGEGAGVFAEVKAPEWAGIFGTAIEMESGETVRVNEAYLLKSITEPDAQVVKGYPAAKMPTRYAVLPQKDLAALVAFIKGLTPSSSPDPAADPSGGAPVATTTSVAGFDEDGPLEARATEAAVRIKSPDVARTPPEGGDARRGEKLVQRLGCMECHTAHGKGAGVFAEVKAPEWAGIFGTAVEMESGETVKITEAYLLRSITEPDAQVVKGYPAAKMPTRYALLPEKDLAALVAFIKGLTPSSSPTLTKTKMD